MNKSKRLTLYLSLIPPLTSFTIDTEVKDMYDISNQIEVVDEIVDIPDTIEVIETIDTMGLDAFLSKLAFKESTNNWKAVNSLGYIGKYQFGRMALDDIGLDTIHKRDFVKDPTIFSDSLQETAIRKLIDRNKMYLKREITLFDGVNVNGIDITESGMLAAAHLVGHASVRNWLMTNDSTVDGNGVTIEHYLEHFKGYNL